MLRPLVLLLVVVLCSNACGRSPEQQLHTPLSPSEGRVIEHDAGETVVPIEPERIVIIGSILDALAFGVEPVGAAYSGIAQRKNAGKLTTIFSEHTSTIEVVGHSNEPDLGAIMSLSPDLIVAERGAPQNYDNFSLIAPTVLIEGSPGAWKDDVTTAAIAMGKEQEAVELISAFEARVELFQQLMGDRLETTVVSVARFRPDHIRMYQQDSFSGAILAEVGLARPESQLENRPHARIDIVDLEFLDGDVLFVMQDNPDNSYLTEVRSHRWWSELQVVAQEQVYEVPLEAWLLNSGIVSAHMILNDLFRTLIPDGEQYVIKEIGALILP